MRLVEIAACAVATVSAVLLLIRGVAGPFTFIAPVHNPLTLECSLAVSLVLLLTLRSVKRPEAVWPGWWRGKWASAAIVGLLASIAYLPILSMPLITDDYIHLRQISSGEAPEPIQCLTQSCGGPNYFRPIGVATYWAEWKLWGTAALPRHAFDLLLHAASSILFFLLLRRVGVRAPLDVLAALLFAFNGILAEAVAWPAARFDALALLFSFMAGLAIFSESRWALPISAAATAGACLSKESAYVLPVLLAMLLARTIRTRAGRKLALANFAVAGGVFVWRWIVLRGIGGYVSPDGAPTVLQLDMLKLAKTFLARIWGILWIPINWSAPLELWMMCGLGLGLAGSLLLLRARPDRARVLLCALGILVACIPTHHMLLIGASLERSRYLAYATPAFVLLLATACAGLTRGLGVAALSLLVLFQLAALEHNLRIWQSVSAARYRLCAKAAGLARSTSGNVAIDGLPLTVDGIYWRNGLEDCMALEFTVPMGKVRVNEPDASAVALRLEWDPATRSVR